MSGARGGTAYSSSSIGVGGAGGRLQATISVNPGQTLNIYVGGQGSNATSSSAGGGGYNGGASGANYSTSQFGGGGGGATDIRIGGTALSNRVLVAGGGGGASSCSGSGYNGGTGGSTTGGTGSNCGTGVNPTGGTQSAGGSAGSYSGYCTATAGSLGNGGNACSPSGGGGGGGGYYGGGGGAWASGGGGSSYSGSAINVTHTAGYNAGNGSVLLSYVTSSSTTCLEALNTLLPGNLAYITSAIPNKYDFAYDGGADYISDGGFDMYDGGNYLNTNFATGIDYTNGTITASTAFGTTGRYFTREMSGLFVVAADLDSVTTFYISGNNGADGGGSTSFYQFDTLVNGILYTCYLKRVVANYDPAIHQLIIIPKNLGATHTYSTNTDNSFQNLTGIANSQSLYYLLFAARSGGNGYSVPDSSVRTVAGRFLSLTSDSSVFIRSVNVGNGCPGTDSITLVYQACNSYLGSTNQITAELSDTNGSFASGTTLLGSIPDTNLIDTITYALPLGLTPSGNYQIRLITSSPADTSNPTSVPSINAIPTAPTWLSTSDLIVCDGDSVIFYDTASSGQTDSTTYELSFSNLTTSNSACGNQGPYSCSDVIEYDWIDGGTGDVISVSFSAFFRINCSTGDSLVFTLNGVEQQTEALTFYDCNCSNTGGDQLVTTVFDPADFIAGDSNHLEISFASGNCVGVDTSSSLNGGVGQVHANYGSTYTFDYSATNTFATLLASTPDTFFLYPDSAMTIWVRASNNITGCEGTDSTFFDVDVSDIGVTASQSGFISCFGSANAEISASDSGGLGTTTYSLDNSVYQASSTFSGLDTGSYVVYVQDTVGCVQASDTVIIDQPDELIVSIDSVLNVSCSNSTDGYLSATAVGGTLPYSFSWSNGETTSTIDSLSLSAYTVTVTDTNGCIDTVSQQLLVLDLTPPNVLTMNHTVYLDAAGQGSASAADVDGGSTDNCGIDSMYIDIDQFDCSDIGSPVQVVLTVIDSSGNSDTAHAHITVLDTIPPVVLTQTHTAYLDPQGNAVIQSAHVDSGSYDSCGIAFTMLSDSIFDCADVGTTSVFLIVTDIYGNADSASANVMVIDTVAPVAIAQNLVVYLDQSGSATAVADSANNGSWDSCGVQSLSLDSTMFNCSHHGDSVLATLTATDVNGNTSSTSLYVFVYDTISPNVYTHNDSVYVDSSGQAFVTASSLNDSTLDNCAIDTMYLSQDTFDCAEAGGITSIWFYAYDVNGNVDSVSLDITVVDTINPEIVCVDSIVVENESGLCGASVSYSNPVGMDNCEVDTVYQSDSTGLVSGSFFPVGATIVEFTVEDVHGNMGTCEMVVMVIDTQAPQLICPNDTVICDSVYTFSLPNYIDNCSGFTVAQTGGIASGGVLPVGNTLNTFSVSDAFGNTDTCSFTVTRDAFPSVADAGEDQYLCDEFIVSIDANDPAIGVGVWTLITGPGSIADTSDNTTEVSQLSLGENQFAWSISNGVCATVTDTITVHINTAANAPNAGEDTILCMLDEYVLNAEPASRGDGFWQVLSGGASIADSSAPASLVENLRTGENELSWTIVNGVCPELSDIVVITVGDEPSITISEDVFIFPSTEVQLEATSDIGTEFTWTPIEGLSDPGVSDPRAAPAETRTYVVEVASELGCTNSDSVTISVNTSLVLPTAFTPDGDGMNDTWNLKELENYPSCVIKIFNRWGHEMFVSEGYTENWKGNYQGEPLPSGSYYYVIDLGSKSLDKLTGSVTIIR